MPSSTLENTFCGQFSPEEWVRDITCNLFNNSPLAGVLCVPDWSGANSAGEQHSTGHPTRQGGSYLAAFTRRQITKNTTPAPITKAP